MSQADEIEKLLNKIRIKEGLKPLSSHAVLAKVRVIIDSLYGKRTDDMYSQALDDIKEKLSEHFS